MATVKAFAIALPLTVLIAAVSMPEIVLRAPY